MSSLNELPPELICQILAYLSSQDLRALKLTSQFWNKFYQTNEASIYHRAAVQHNFVESMNVPLDDALNGKGKYLSGVHGWRELCRRGLTLERNWARHGCHPLNLIATDHPDVHRIKVDEEVGIVITTHADGGLVVRDMDTGEVLWGLPRTYVRSYAHCEYSNGFLIFDRLGQAKEVWRLATEYERSPLPADEFQQEISFTINQFIGPSKGNFKPWALLVMPELGRAFRFVYPVLLVSGLTRAYLYHVETGELIQTITETQAVRDSSALGDINYVELNAFHVLICGTLQLRIFERGSGNLLYSMSPRRSTFDCIQVAVDYDSGAIEADLPAKTCLVAPLAQHELHEQGLTPQAQFVAVHTSPDGKTVVALLSDCRLLVIKDIGRLIKGEACLRESAVVVHLFCPDHAPAAVDSSGIYLAFEYGRVGVITTSGVFVVTLDAIFHGLEDPWTLRHGTRPRSPSSFIRDSPYPSMIICRILPFAFRDYLDNVTCLQLTQSKMFFTWHPDIVPPRSQQSANPNITNSSESNEPSGMNAGAAPAQLHLPNAEHHNTEDDDAVVVILDDEDAEMDEDEDDEDDEDEQNVGFIMNPEPPFAGFEGAQGESNIYAKAVAYLDFTPKYPNEE
ncbi:hypothetical protein NM688_g5135 [Phlebia brevispora]|uniref:Uncharacterized protein n=1 Tax=Phlebia brevispora TaxID=194682 RepID=A0ACC1T0E4_9APHY|nr:hypothetical protein NM688_g5135 [Phlebia brevispora]